MNTEEILSSYKHQLNIQIRFKDIDKLGHVNNANHFTYFETGRVDYFKAVFKNRVNWVKQGMILGKIEITYKQPIFLEDTVCCYSKISRFGSKSFDIDSFLTSQNQAKKNICAISRSTLVCIDYETKETIKLPDEWIESVISYEKESPLFLRNTEHKS